MPTRCTGSSGVRTRSGFTLVELLVVISILAILVVMTVTSINFAISTDLTRSASRQVQSYLAGARDRAIYAKEPRGVRFILDPNNPTAVTSMVYIAPSPDWTQGVIRLERIDRITPLDGVPDTIMNVRGGGTDWRFLYERGQIKNGTRIKIPGDDSGSWYTIDLPNSPISKPSTPPGAYDPNNDEVLRLTTAYRDAGTSEPDEVIAFTPGSGPSTYLLELPPVVLSGEEPTLLPNNAGIDLDRSLLPPSWRPPVNLNHVNLGDDMQPGKAGIDDNSSGGADDVAELLWPGTDDFRIYSSQLDLMFSPRGSVLGSEASSGKIHFLIDTLENIQASWQRDTVYAEGAVVQLPPRGSYEYMPYDRSYICTKGGTSGPSASVFTSTAANGPRETGAIFTTDGSVEWEVLLNSSPSLLTIFTRTGSINAYPMAFDDIANTPPDVFYYAETGEAAK
ncbi:pilus assembly FimT family protein [Gimesia fumaroli]|uniref:pilus assembly FimT family protein n=1 Tax=Gimesia fumaroli TaxID=2527976 RepID=UPI0018D7477A|nr:prepilin-type N-terminal cleavage/methylation domain-containing protein [Gimesia fumaroli]